MERTKLFVVHVLRSPFEVISTLARNVKIFVALSFDNNQCAAIRALSLLVLNSVLFCMTNENVNSSNFLMNVHHISERDPAVTQHIFLF